ncbi:uncharacterized protein LOC6573994 [Drosophila mojavensis]|uniref:Uncharacterized protein n=1 Tax=Drosophila mojavensis TaxID=7230 RepID=B4K8U5_DROMO|nr:uncharacterized protein LOC6573994 [Drosophila mojavensis]EDW15514.1 uncharacterized protein Dmoj_GI24875 [Drosophila mojavensis]
MNMSNLSVDGEFRYIIQWFNEWSELQRDDFVYVLVEYLTRDTSVSAGGDGHAGSTYVNGVVNALATSGVQEKPMSLFQCRIKLFRQWSPKWPIEFKSKLQEKITELDPKVGEKIINELKTSHSMHNGDVSVNLNVNGTSGNGYAELEQTTAEQETLPSTIETQAAAAVATTTTTTAADATNGVSDQTLDTVNDNHLAAVLRQETPVDDDDDDKLAGNDSNADTNGIRGTSSSVTTIAVNTSPAEQSPLQPQQQQQSQSTIEPVEQVENNVSASVIVSVAAAPEVVPVA